jgi:predicted RNase H-like HicB family nuclease
VRYWVIYETDEEGGWSAYVPDLPGCVAAAETHEEVRRLVRVAITLHLAGIREDGEPFPQPTDTWAEIIEVPEDVISRAASLPAR